MVLRMNTVQPLFTKIMGYCPGGRFGLIELPATAARELRLWARQPHWLSDAEGRPLRPYNAEIRAPMRHITLADDEVVPPGADIDYAYFYPNVRRSHDHYEPRHYGVDAVGHFGFFRKSMPRQAWVDVAEWLIANART
jgi:predicted alpha/beta hydrolase